MQERWAGQKEEDRQNGKERTKRERTKGNQEGMGGIGEEKNEMGGRKTAEGQGGIG